MRTLNAGNCGLPERSCRWVWKSQNVYASGQNLGCGVVRGGRGGSGEVGRRVGQAG